MAYFIGLMSGTSLDGVDGVLLDCSKTALAVKAHAYLPMPAELRESFALLNQPQGQDELHRAALAGNALARLYAQVVGQLKLKADQPIAAIGAHGQTVRHQPQAFDGVGYTVQINQPALLAELTGITVVADFRNRDVAAGGQGAPLVPAFHAQYFGLTKSQAVLNIGGMANVTWKLDDAPAGFDCGPGNVLLDAWCAAHHQASFDDGGQWAAQGKVNAELLKRYLSDPYFEQAPPKSTGREKFNLDWVRAGLVGLHVSEVDVQATLLELTAQSITFALQQARPDLKTLWVCGGGVQNRYLMQRLAHHLPAAQVQSTQAKGLDPMYVEAAAFAWLAYQAMAGQAIDLHAATGAKGPRRLGAIYVA